MLKKRYKFYHSKLFPMQLGFMSHKKNHVIKPHTHRNYLRKIKKTTEVLFVNSGILKLIFMDPKKISI